MHCLPKAGELDNFISFDIQDLISYISKGRNQHNKKASNAKYIEYSKKMEAITRFLFLRNLHNQDLSAHADPEIVNKLAKRLLGFSRSEKR